MTEWLTFITTLILAGITLWYVLLTRKMVKISQEMLRVSNTPEVQVSLQFIRKDISDMASEIGNLTDKQE